MSARIRTGTYLSGFGDGFGTAGQRPVAAFVAPARI